MLINQANLDALFISFSKIYEDAYMGAPSIYERIATTVPSNTRDQRYPIVQALSAAMREWTGPRVVQNLALDGIVVTNKKFESTVGLDRLDVQFDQYQVFANMTIPLLAQNAKKLPDELLASLITANGTGYDGVAFFSASHPYDPTNPASSTQANVFTSAPLNATTYAKVRAAMRNFKKPDGAPFNLEPSTLMVPPSLEYTALTLSNAQFYPESKNNVSGTFGSQSNIWAGKTDVVINPYLADTGDPTTAVWYLLAAPMTGMRPFIWQEFQAPEFTPIVDPSNPIVFQTDQFQWGVRRVGNAALGPWFLAAKAGP